ncbi:MAG: ECF transporter S component [Paludibacteraceae bacterium]|nr:ECF transporter S component [Paludibacteraceae bacterium]
MTTTETRLYTLDFKEARTYLWALAFVAGNIILPQLFHTIPDGGKMFLPIYFFTLVGAYKYGWKTGLLTAALSPVVNSALFGMPSAALLPVILLKSIVLAVAAGWVAEKTQKATLLTIAAVVATYQLIGGAGEWIMTGSLDAAMQDIRLGLPGIALQIFGGFLFIKYVLKK